MADDRVDDAASALYAAAPEEFLATRTEFARQAKADGDAAAAARIEKLRKPTVAAWVVNAYVHHDSSVVERLVELGDRLRSAQEALDAVTLRELTGERRKLVDGLTRNALAQAGKRGPAAGLRDEVAGTFEAALADPEIAGRLGRLVRAETFSGFGFLPSTAPQLSVVRSGPRSAPAAKAGGAASDSKPTTPKPSTPQKSAADRRKEQKAIADAQRALDEAETAFGQAQATERDLVVRVKQLSKRLAKIQDDLDDARESLDAARHDVAAAKAQRRDARTAFDRAERAARA